MLRHLRMLWNSFRLQRNYKNSFQPGFIYYPLHVPADFALTIRSPEFLDQFAFIDFLCRIAPIGRHVVIKEHPALVGAFSANRIKDLLKLHDNLTIVHPSLNNHKLLRKAAVVVTINSKAGAEALLHGRPVIVLGDAFYRSSSLVTLVVRLDHLGPAIKSLLSNSICQNQMELEQYFQGVWNRSYAGELYDLTDKNIVNFTESIMRIFPCK